MGNAFFTENELRNAAYSVRAAMLRSLPAPSDCETAFSSRFLAFSTVTENKSPRVFHTNSTQTRFGEILQILETSQKVRECKKKTL